MTIINGQARHAAAVTLLAANLTENDIFLACYDNDLIPASVAGGEVSIVTNDDDVLAVAGSSSFLPRLQLFGSSSDAVKEGKIGVAHWGLARGKDEIEDLGKEADILVIAGRVKALDVSGQTAVVSYDRHSDTFKSIAARSEANGSRCMFGPEYLVWVPSAKTFATLFLSSPTARRETRALHARLRKAATCKAQLIEGKQHKWHGPVFTPCTTQFEMPEMPALTQEAERFTNPNTAATPELAAPAEADRAR